MNKGHTQQYEQLDLHGEYMSNTYLHHYGDILTQKDTNTLIIGLLNINKLPSKKEELKSISLIHTIVKHDYDIFLKT